LTTTSSLAEFEKSQAFVQAVENLGIRVFCVPGNHDQYTRVAYQSQTFYDYFPAQWDEKSPYNLKRDGVTSCQLTSHWHLVGLDTAIATSWFLSTGLFSEKTEKHLTELLSSFAPDDRIILMNHFPFFAHESPRKRLVRGENLRKLLEKFPQVKIYCHGHTHRQCLANLQNSHLPIIFDAGSTTLRKEGTWHAMELTTEHLVTKVYSWTEDAWQQTRLEQYGVV
jgi:3',5'-cyclic AMP phosphodiesterase CpdA